MAVAEGTGPEERGRGDWGAGRWCRRADTRAYGLGCRLIRPVEEEQVKFCYVDESGTGDEPYAVMAGVIVDALRMHITKSEWKDLLEVLSAIVGRPVSEIHTRDFYPGNSPWRGLAGDFRARVITAVFDWLSERKHRIVYCAVDKGRFKREFETEAQAGEVQTLWRFMALHLCLAVQKHHQRLEKNKGNTVLVFDNEPTEEDAFVDLVASPPSWTDTYYARGSAQRRLDQIVDVPHFVDSRRVGLIQVADLVSYFLRRHIEIEQGGIRPRYDGEDGLVAQWAGMAMSQSIPKYETYPKRSRCECADLFYRYAPACIL